MTLYKWPAASSRRRTSPLHTQTPASAYLHGFDPATPQERVYRSPSPQATSRPFRQSNAPTGERRHQGRFGLRWDPAVDLLDTPDTAGAFVLFFGKGRAMVGVAENIHRRVMQCWHAPGRKFKAFSWIELQNPHQRDTQLAALKQKSYRELWEDIR